jgi:hypothetical protein
VNDRLDKRRPYKRHRRRLSRARRRNCLVVTNGVPCGARLPDVVAIHVGRADEAAAERPIDDLPAVDGPPNEDWLKS